MENKILKIFSKDRDPEYELSILNEELLEVIKSPEDCEIVMGKLGLENRDFTMSECSEISPLLSKIVDINPKSAEKVLDWVDRASKKPGFYLDYEEMLASPDLDLNKIELPQYPESYSPDLDNYTFDIEVMNDTLSIIDMVAQKRPDLKRKALDTLKNIDALEEVVRISGLKYCDEFYLDVIERERQDFESAEEKYRSSSLKLKTGLLKQKDKTQKVIPTVASMRNGRI